MNNVVISGLDAVMYVVQSKAEKNMIYGELLSIAECTPFNVLLTVHHAMILGNCPT